MNALNLVALPLLFGLFGFIEPCTIGSALVLVKQIEERTRAQRIVQTLVFALTRALFIGAAGLLAAVLGSAFLGLQKAAWLLLGVLYIALGLVYVLGKAGVLMRSFGPSLSRMRSVQGSVALGLLFGLNIPARKVPVWTGALLIALGVWSVWFALFVSLDA